MEPCCASVSSPVHDISDGNNENALLGLFRGLDVITGAECSVSSAPTESLLCVQHSNGNHCSVSSAPTGIIVVTLCLRQGRPIFWLPGPH